MRNCYYWLGIALSIPLSILLQRFYFRDSNAAPVRPYGHLIILTHKDIPCLHIAAEKFADPGVHVLIGVKSAEMLSRFQSEAMRRKGNGDGEVLKGIETMLVDLDEPAHIANIVFRSTEMVRQLDRPLIGVVILYPGALHSPFIMYILRDTHK